MAKEKVENLEFQSEVKQLLDILVYSLYKHKEVFLRELISNAVDALNKVQFEILTQADMDPENQDLKIDISFIQSQQKLVVEDTGIGMTRNELIENIGTIAHSGTVNFLQKLNESKEKDRIDLIGRFGVGFYASFMVAKEIHIYTRSFKKGSKAFLWKSTGDNRYSIEETVKKNRGTRIELFLKKEEKEFLEKFTVKNIIHKHSRFVPFPIYVENEKIESTDAIWTQPKSSLKEKDYVEFFKFLENSDEEPDTFLHLSSDAPVQFNALLYIPKSSIELLGFFKADPGVDLYSRKVLIQKHCKDIMPEYLRFVKGIIDSEDIPLNISRETIQNNIKIEKIKKYVLKKLFEHLEKMKDKERKRYLGIWKHFNRHLKEGIVSDFENKEKLSKLLLFTSSKTAAEEFTDFSTYIERMPKEQKEIYFVSGTSIGSLKKNPALEAFRKKDYEVLYLTDPIDEFVMEHLHSIDGKRLKVVESADIKIDAEGVKEDDEHIKDLPGLISYLKTRYGERVADVKASDRLVDSPCLLVHPDGSPSIQMEKIMRMTQQDYTFSKKIFEINPGNSLIREMITLHKKDPLSLELKTISLQLLDNMFIREGILEDVDNVVPRIQDIMLMALRKV